MEEFAGTRADATFIQDGGNLLNSVVVQKLIDRIDHCRRCDPLLPGW